MSSEPDPRDANGPAAPDTGFIVHPSLSKFQVPVKTYLCSNSEFDAIAVGALVFRNTAANFPQRELLIIQRSGTDFFPNKWEIPGGACDLEDATLMHGLARELWEETGFNLAHVSQLVRSLRTSDSSVFAEGAQFCTPGGVQVVKYSFIVDVLDPKTVTLHPSEHQRYKWIDREAFKKREIDGTLLDFTTEQQAATIGEAFELAKGS